MDDELLSDILAAEREIRLQIDTLEQQTTGKLETLRQELEQTLGDEFKALQAELEQSRCRAEQSALQESDALLAEARAFALRLKNLDTQELDKVMFRHLSRILPEGAH
jgi:vacuolar-type H+-ATPase subunit H